MWLKFFKVIYAIVSVIVALILFIVGSQTLFFYAAYGSAIVHHSVPLDRVLFAVIFWSIITFGIFGISTFMLGGWMEKRKKSPIQK